MKLWLFLVALIMSWGILTGKKSTVGLMQKSLIGAIRLFDYKRLFDVSSSSHNRIHKAYHQPCNSGHQNLGPQLPEHYWPEQMVVYLAG